VFEIADERLYLRRDLDRLLASAAALHKSGERREAVPATPFRVMLRPSRVRPDMRAGQRFARRLLLC